MSEMMAVETVREAGRAQVLLAVPRLRILEEAREAVSASEVARRLGSTRQKIRYHMRELARAGFLLAAGERRKRNMLEQLYVATARSFVLAPELLGRLRARPERAAEAASAEQLLTVATQAQHDLIQVLEQAADVDQTVPTLSLHSNLRFRSPGQRAAFARALRDAVVDVVEKYTVPFENPDGSTPDGRPHRLVLGCYPVPREQEEEEDHE